MEYHKIQTLFERDAATFKVQPGVFKNRVYSIIKTWHWTEKVDGTNIRAMWKDGVVSFGGRTDNAQIHGDLIKHLYETITPDKFRAVFPDADVVLYGEGYGAGIQKCGGLYGPKKKFILFDVLVDGQWWLSHEGVVDVAEKMGLDRVPYFGEMTIDEATEMVRRGFKSQVGLEQAESEGLVGRPVEALFDKQGRRLIVKLKTKDF